MQIHLHLKFLITFTPIVILIILLELIYKKFQLVHQELPHPFVWNHHHYGTSFCAIHSYLASIGGAVGHPWLPTLVVVDLVWVSQIFGVRVGFMKLLLLRFWIPDLRARELLDANHRAFIVLGVTISCLLIDLGLVLWPYIHLTSVVNAAIICLTLQSVSTTALSHSTLSSHCALSTGCFPLEPLQPSN